MTIHVYGDAALASQAAALLFAAQLLKKPASVIGLATGSTPLQTYAQLAAWHRQGLLDFSQCVSFNLDEYVGLAAEHPASYHAFMQENLFRHINLKASHVPDGMAASPQEEGARYDRAIAAAGGIDIQFLGIGNNGHIGFNEPAAEFTYGTHQVELTPSTIQANRRFFASEQAVPRRAISMGIGAIMQARSIVMVALGAGKAQAVQGMVKGEITPANQASILRAHPDCTVLLDQEAAQLL